MMISTATVIIGLLILAIPFMILFLLIKFLAKKQEKSGDLELRIQILEEEIKQIKRQIEFIDEI